MSKKKSSHRLNIRKYQAKRQHSKVQKVGKVVVPALSKVHLKVIINNQLIRSKRNSKILSRNLKKIRNQKYQH